MKTNLPSIEGLTEVLTENHKKIKGLLEQRNALKASIAEKNAAIREDHLKLNAVIEDISNAVRLCNLSLQRHGADLAMEVSKELSFAVGNNHAYSGFTSYPSHTGAVSPAPAFNPTFIPGVFPADVGFRTQEQNDAVVQAGLTATKAQKMLDEIIEFKKENPGSVWFKAVEKNDG